MPEAFIKFERRLSGPNEVFTSHGRATPHYRPVLEEIEGMGAGEWDRRVRRAHGRMLEEQLRVGVSSGDRTHPTDYSACQDLAGSAREARIDVLRYASARRSGAVNVAVLPVTRFASSAAVPSVIAPPVAVTTMENPSLPRVMMA